MPSRGRPDDRGGRSPDERALETRKQLEAFAELARRGSRTAPVSTPASADDIRPTLGRTIVAAGVVLIAALTLIPSTEGGSASFWCVLHCGDRMKADVLLNMLLFAPLGVGLGLLGMRLPRAILLAFLGTACVELLQWAVVPGRDASARDIVANTVGAAMGFALGERLHRWMVPHPRAALQVAIVASVAWLASQGVTAVLVAPWLPPPDWWARIRPEYTNGPVYQSTFAGRILAVDVGGISMPQSDEITKAWNAREALLSGDEPLRVTVDSVRPSSGHAPIVIVTAGPVYDVVSWVQDGRDALFQSSTRGARAGMRVPAVRLKNAMPVLPVDGVTLEGSYAHGRYLLRATKNGVTRERRLDASASRVWMFLVRTSRYALGDEVAAVTALWLAAAWLVVGLWYFRAATYAGPRVVAGALAATAVLGLAVVPRAVGIPISGWTEWLAVAVGIALAWALSWITRRRARPASL